MRLLFKSCFPFFESALISCNGLVIFTVPRILIAQRPALWFGVGGHLHIADLLALLFALPFRPVNMTVFSGFTKGTSLRGHGEFVRGLVEVVFFTPFHGGMITRKRKEIKA